MRNFGGPPPPIFPVEVETATQDDKRAAALNRRTLDRSTMLLEPADTARQRYASQGLPTTSHPYDRDHGTPAAPTAFPVEPEADPRARFAGTSEDDGPLGPSDD